MVTYPIVSTQRMFVFALFISLFVHLVSVFLIKVRFVDAKYPGPHWVSIGIKDDLWFESGIELPSARFNPDKREMEEFFYYGYDSQNLNLLSPKKPVASEAIKMSDVFPFAIEQEKFSNAERIDFRSGVFQGFQILSEEATTVLFNARSRNTLSKYDTSTGELSNVEMQRNLGSKHIVREVHAVDAFLGPEQTIVEDAKIGWSDYFDLDGPITEREVLFVKLPDYLLQEIRRDINEQILPIKIKFWVKNDGTVGFTKVLQSSGIPIIDAHTVLSLKEWRFVSVLDKDDQISKDWGTIVFNPDYAIDM